MENSDKKRFAVVLGLLGATFKNEITPLVMQAYFSAMSDLTIEQVEHAGNRWLATGKFFPKPVELRELAKPDTADYEAGQAWILAVQCVSDHPRPLAFTDTLIHATIRRLGGRATFSQIGAIELERFWRSRFIDEYKRLRAMETIPASMLAPLSGMVAPTHYLEDRSPIRIACEYATTTPRIEHRPSGQINDLVLELSEQKRISN